MRMDGNHYDALGDAYIQLFGIGQWLRKLFCGHEWQRISTRRFDHRARANAQHFAGWRLRVYRVPDLCESSGCHKQRHNQCDDERGVRLVGQKQCFLDHHYVRRLL